MRTLHDLKDLAMIYHEYEWDHARISVWQPNEQRKMELSFTGSTRPGVKSENDPGELNFNAYYTDELGDNCVLSSFRAVLGKIIDSKFDMTINWESEFLKEMVEKRKA